MTEARKPTVVDGGAGEPAATQTVQAVAGAAEIARQLGGRGGWLALVLVVAYWAIELRRDVDAADLALGQLRAAQEAQRAQVEAHERELADHETQLAAQAAQTAATIAHVARLERVLLEQLYIAATDARIMIGALNTVQAQVAPAAPPLPVPDVNERLEGLRGFLAGASVP